MPGALLDERLDTLRGELHDEPAMDEPREDPALGLERGRAEGSLRTVGRRVAVGRLTAREHLLDEPFPPGFGLDRHRGDATALRIAARARFYHAATMGPDDPAYRGQRDFTRTVLRVYDPF